MEYLHRRLFNIKYKCIYDRIQTPDKQWSTYIEDCLISSTNVYMIEYRPQINNGVPT